MIPASAVLVLVGAVLLVLGLVDGDGGLGLLLASIGTCVVAAVVLAVGVARMRPRPGGALVGEPTAWSGARPAPGEEAGDATSGADGDDAGRLDAALADVPGIGPAEREALLTHFGGYRWVRYASVEAIAAVPGIAPDTAERIHARLQG